MLSAESFWTKSLHSHPLGEPITRILAAAINAVEPGLAVRRAIRREGDRLILSSGSYNLDDYKDIRVLALGKAALPMAEAAAEVLGDRLTSTLVITKHLPPNPISRANFTLQQGDHPVPGEHSLEGGKRLVEFISTLHSEDLLVCLISGGGSALVSAPVEGITLQDQQVLASTLLASGADIEEFNALRRRLDRVKGGGIVRLAKDAAILSLIISDVIGSPLEAIASGPTAPDPTTHQRVLDIIEKYSLRDSLPAPVIAALENAPETPKPDEAIFKRVQNVLIASSLTAAQAALKQAQAEGFNPYLLCTDLHGEASQVAFELSTFLRQAKKMNTPVPAPACIVAAGETTVTLKGNGRGGRNTELALASVSELADFPGVMLVTLASDGEDGPTDAAGAVVTPQTYRRVTELGLLPGDFLERNDSYTLFASLGDLLKPGPTGTNVNDLVFLFTF